jgi:hypothetical protein
VHRQLSWLENSLLLYTTPKRIKFKEEKKIAGKQGYGEVEIL